MAGKRTTAAILALLAAGTMACGSKEKAVVVRDPTAEVLAYVPADAAAVAVVQTDLRARAGAALARLGARIPGGGLVAGELEAALGRRIGLDSATELRPLAGHPVAAWSPDASRRRVFAAWVATDADRLGALLDARVRRGTLTAAGEVGGFSLLTRATGGALAHKGPILVSAPDLAALRVVLARRAAARGQWSAGLLRARRLGLPGGAVAEVLADARPLRGSLFGPGAVRVPWVAALQRVAVTVAAERAGLRMRVRLSTDARSLTDADVPIAGGVAPPVTRGTGRLVAAVRDPRHLLGFLRSVTDLVAPRRLDGLRTVEALLGRYAGVSLQNDIVAQLTGSATLTSEDLRSGTVRADLADAGAVSGVLGRFRTLARLGGPLASLAGVDLQGYGIDERDGDDVVTRDERDVVALSVRDGALVASTTPGADLAAAARAPVVAPPPPPAGALRASVDPELWQEALVRRLGLPAFARGPLAPLGRLVLTAWGGRAGLDVQVVVPVAG